MPTAKFLQLWTILSLFSIIISALSQKSLYVVLNSKWLETSLHLEASEFLAEESSELFWKFIDDIAHYQYGDTSFHSRTPKQQYDIIIEVAGSILSPAKLALLKFSLALRAHSPTIEMFHQIADDKRLPDCEAVVEIGGEFTCDIPKLSEILRTAEDRPKCDIYKVDHQYPSLRTFPIVAVLYGEIGTLSFNNFHKELKLYAENQKINYIVRHYIRSRTKNKVKLSGYGVELAIKSTEYKAQDDAKVQVDVPQQENIDMQDEVQGFLFSKLKSLHPEKKEKLDELKNYLLDSMKEVASLKVWELQELSLQAGQRIMSSPVEEALRVMKEISQNFPTRAQSLIQIAVNENFRREVDRNQQMFLQYHNLASSDTALFLNGMYFDMEVTDVFTLLQILKQETKMLEGLHRIGVPEAKITKFLKMDFTEDKQEYAVDIRDSAVQYINNMETDRNYRNWPGSVQDMLRPTYPGMLRNVRKNIYNMVVIVDPSRHHSKDILKLAESFYVHKAPVRIGLVFAVNADMSVSGFHDAGVAMLEAFNFISLDKSAYEGLSFFTDVYAAVEEKELNVKDVIKVFKTKYPNEDLDLVFGMDSDYDTGRKLAWDFVNRTGIGNPPQVLINGAVLKQNQLNADMFEEAVLSEIMRQTPFIQKSIYKGDLTDDHIVLDFLMEQKNVMPRLNQRVLSSTGVYLDLTGKSVKDLSTEDMSKLPQSDVATSFSACLKYLTKREEESNRPLTVWVVGDLDTKEGRALLTAALIHLKADNDLRLGIVHNPSNSINKENTLIGTSVQAALEGLNPTHAKLFITKLMKENNADALQKGEKQPLDFNITNMDVISYEAALEKEGDFLRFHRIFCQKVLGIAPGARVVIVNGKVLGPLASGEEFTEDDFNLLERYFMNIYGKKLSEELKEEKISPQMANDIMMKAASVLMSQPQNRIRHDVKFYGDKYSVVKIPASDPSEPAHELIAILDPVSRGAQKLSTILSVLQRVINSHLKLFLNCVDKHSSMPLKSFFNFVLEAEPEFNIDGSFRKGPMAKFNNLPTSPLLTLGMVTPENWLVEAVQSIYDLDNIHFEQVEGNVHAVFELEHLLLEGHCFEQTTGNPPRGLQFTLGTNSTPVIVDTIVMANLGYFQLKANPGAWLLRLRQGRSSDIYDIVSHEGTDSPLGSSEVVVVISNFRSNIIKTRVNKKAGKQFEELLYDDEESQGGIWNSITSMPIIGGIVAEWRAIGEELFSTFTGDKMDKTEEEESKINIFSLASGHLYERLLRIMMLSVLKKTNTPVKFWFLKNYLSPIFKDFLPSMAKKYGFEYELVQYKWPRWLNQQTEKQRLIWGYKILFLDVLFPLDVKKIIFVDADQVVRGDLKELRDLDLGGAPYGYTPFCDSRKDMEGYRFWKTGYWASHLGSRKYHISALYVVDLKKFRRIAAGDRLRGQYQGLSQDPNSLSNLDQDLPNNMIHQVNIKSLPQEWLWCETWCDDHSKQYAKTIDLCNNPKTKEPKLVSAMRIIPEWKDYDGEIKQLFEDYQKNRLTNLTTLTEEKHTDHHEEL